jgi:hypothetical protein
MMSTMCAETKAQPARMGAVLERRLDELARRAAPLIRANVDFYRGPRAGEPFATSPAEAPAIRMTNRGLTTTFLRRGCSGRTRERGMRAAHIPRRSDAG